MKGWVRVRGGGRGRVRGRVRVRVRGRGRAWGTARFSVTDRVRTGMWAGHRDRVLDLATMSGNGSVRERLKAFA